MRYFDMRVLGKFAVIMADPPWDIHMELPYGEPTTLVMLLRAFFFIYIYSSYA